MNNRLRVAVVGCGIGRGHVRAFHMLPDYYDVRAVCDLDENKARSVAEEFEVNSICTDFKELLKMEDVQIVDICTPSYLHFQQILEALAAGKHVIAEKPVCGSLKEMDELISAQAQTGLRLMPIFQSRFGVGVQKLKLLVDKGISGPAYLATTETHWRRRMDYYTWHGKWKTELGGPVVTLAIHAHDILNFVLGKAKSVFARMSTRVNPIETEDCVSASVELENGALASLSVTTGSVVQITRHRMIFKNMVAESPTAPHASTSDPWNFTGDTPEHSERIEKALAEFSPKPEGFPGQFLGFYHAFQSGGKMPVTLADARNSIELITALYASARMQQSIDLPITSDHPYYEGWQQFMESRSP